MPTCIQSKIELNETEANFDERLVPSGSEQQDSKTRLTPEEVEDLRFGLNAEAVGKLDQIDTAQLLCRLDKIIRNVELDIKSRYPAQRKSYCAIQLQLNKRFARKIDGVSCPAFRSRLKLTNRPKGAEQILSNDTQIIDMHFMYCKRRRTVGEGYARNAFSGDEFDFDDALRFARTVGKTELKLEVLGIANNRLMQFQLVTYNNKEVYDAGRWIKKKLDENMGTFESLAEDNYRVKGNERVWAVLLTAEKACEKLGLEVKPKSLADYARMIGGLTGRPDKLKRKLESAKNYI